MALAKAAPTVSAYVAKIRQADVYFNDIAATGVIPSSIVGVVNGVMLGVNAVGKEAAMTPTVQSLLAQAYTTIQNSSTPPTVNPALVVSAALSVPAPAPVVAAPASTPKHSK